MFFGRYEHTLDDKGRLTIPSRFRDALNSNTAFVTRGFDNNLIVWPMDVFEKIQEKLRAHNIANVSERDFTRWLYSSAAMVEFDRTGRVLLPSSLRALIQMDSSAVLVGMGEYFEIWTPEQWAEHEKRMDNVEDNAQRWAAFHLSLD